MSLHDSLSPYAEPSPGEFKRVLAATGVIGALFLALIVFAPQHDPTRVVAHMPCSVLSEDTIGVVLGTEMRLSPSGGTVCQYVSTSAASRTLFVIARHDPALPATMASGTRIAGVGDEAVRSQNVLYARYGSRAYTFDIVPHAGDDPRLFAQELRLARLLNNQMVAQNH